MALRTPNAKLSDSRGRGKGQLANPAASSTAVRRKRSRWALRLLGEDSCATNTTSDGVADANGRDDHDREQSSEGDKEDQGSTTAVTAK